MTQACRQMTNSRVGIEVFHFAAFAHIQEVTKVVSSAAKLFYLFEVFIVRDTAGVRFLN